ncbi:MAG TPA: phosphatase PAP2 family protein, partial [Acidimicrobiales bacterium]|nr:phosphatase PAP2 family protein [Acidimicrobiales bacterium]
MTEPHAPDIVGAPADPVHDPDRNPEDKPQEDPPSARSRLRWWKEVGLVLAFYVVYSIVRNTQGSAVVSEARALRNALEVIRWEEALGIYHEERIQDAFLGWNGFIEFWNLFYGTFHFFVTIFALVWLFRRFPSRYRRWRNTLAATTALALIGFATYPLMPPRLLPAAHGYVDTLRVYGSLWSFDSGTMSKISNQ